MIWQECNDPQNRKVYYKAKRSSFRSRINYTYTKTSTQPRKTQNTCAFKYDFENVKNDSKMEPTSSKNGSKMRKMAPKWTPKELPRRPPNGPEGFKMVQEAPRWPQGGSKRSPRIPKMAQRDPRWGGPRTHNMTQRGRKMAPKGHKMAT